MKELALVLSAAKMLPQQAAALMEKVMQVEIKHLGKDNLRTRNTAAPLHRLNQEAGMLDAVFQNLQLGLPGDVQPGISGGQHRAQSLHVVILNWVINVPRLENNTQCGPRGHEYADNKTRRAELAGRRDVVNTECRSGSSKTRTDYFDQSRADSDSFVRPRFSL
ncbi:hypothetical protein CORC01_07557 [Colletotrichum orchidophilum]|uniref:Uncharacterized protein n=1 Tax=Colletotrichum orchidophilum TaxID=1209926 RepID=A0A1G4B708_9PEZI|nr:uncharacterized protein CORC01_07557 [Colletotrichum orchidophilum]OHE97116.1 hypothetical protein CORC01_07557 [Colletotrichum orchidophilum]